MKIEVAPFLPLGRQVTITLYIEVCTVVRTDPGLSESFEVKVGLHQGSILSPLLFAVVMDVVSSEVRRGLPSELLYADGLVLMAPTMEQQTLESGPVVSVGKECRQTLFSAHYVKNGFTRGAVVCVATCRG